MATSQITLSRCINCKLRNQSFCREARGEVFEELASISQTRVYEAGETIVAQGGRSDRVGRVLRGVLKLVKSLPDGRDQIIGLAHPSEFFGRLYSPNSDYSIEAATDVSLCMIDRETFEKMLRRYPLFEHQAHLLSLRQLDSARERIMLLACQTTAERLASYLALRMLQGTGGRLIGRPSAVVHSPISRRDFAGYLSTTVETVSRNVQSLARARIIRIIDSGTFEILEPDELIRCSGQSEEDLLSMIEIHARVDTAPLEARMLA